MEPPVPSPDPVRSHSRSRFPGLAFVIAGFVAGALSASALGTVAAALPSVVRAPEQTAVGSQELSREWRWERSAIEFDGMFRTPR